MTDHTITPPIELVQQWMTEERSQDYFCITEQVAHRAAQWGADQELEACCKLLERSKACCFMDANDSASEYVQAARRPKRPSLKEQALIALDDAGLDAAHENILRRALEALPDG